MRVFVSYHSPDRTIAEQFATALCAQDAGIKVFLDKWALQPGAFWLPALDKELKCADAVVLLLGKTSPGPWQTLEFYAAFDRKATQPKFPVIPVVLTDSAPRLPFLGQLHWLHFDDPTSEPALAQLLPALHGEPLPLSNNKWQAINPYRGLVALSEADAEVFFGRDALTCAILERLSQDERGLMLVGNSGVGKSSLVQAGVIAALRRQRWPSTHADPWPPALCDSRTWLFLTMRPGTEPLGALARAFVSQWTEPTDPKRDECAEKWEKRLNDGGRLRGLLQATIDQLTERADGKPPPRFVLVVDQGEELYTRAAPKQRERFSHLLAEVADLPELVVLGSLRSDHYGCLQDDDPLFRTLARVDVPPLCEAELCEVIGRPPALLGARFEDDAMVPQLAAEAAGEPGALPLLSYLLGDLWVAMQARGDGVLHAADYAERGELRGVLSQRAEAYVQRCSSEQQRTLMRLFTLRLAHVSAEGDVVRRRAHRDECSAAEWAMAQDLASPGWGLLVTSEEAGQPTVEVAHEILLRRWNQLCNAIREQRDFLYWKDWLDRDRRGWQQNGYKNGDLLREGPLDRALHWLKERGDDLDREECAFIEVSDRERERERAARERRRQWIGVGSLVTAAFMAMLSGLAMWQWYEAGKQRTAAEVAKAEAQAQRDRAVAAAAEAQEQRDTTLRTQSRFFAALSQQQTATGDTTTSILLALEGLPQDMAHRDRPYVPEAEEALFAAIQTHGERRVPRSHSGPIQSAAFSPDGQRVVTASADSTARLWEAASGRKIAILRGHSGPVQSAAFSPDGQRVVTASADSTARLWEAASGRKIAVLRSHSGPVQSAAFSPDGQRVITTSADSTARLWEAASGREIAILRGHSGPVQSAAFSPDGQRVVTASADSTARLWRVFATTQQLIEYARSIVPRKLTPEQRRWFLLEEHAPGNEPTIAPRAILTPASPVAADPPE